MAGLHLVDELHRNIRFAAKSLRRSPGFTAAAALTLALGIGANTVVFSVVEFVILDPLPYADTESIVLIRGVGENARRLSGDDFLALRSQARLVDVSSFLDPGNSAYDFGTFRYSRVTRDTFRVLGVSPLLGPRIDFPDYDLAYERSIIVSYGFWQTHLGGDPDVIGRQLNSRSGATRQIVGVMPRDFFFPDPDVDRGSGNFHPSFLSGGQLWPATRSRVVRDISMSWKT